MRRCTKAVPASLTGLALLLSAAATARAMMVAPSPIAQRVATADMIVVGKVTSIEPKTVKAARYPGDREKGEYLIAVVQVEEGFLRARGLTHVRVGFQPPPPPPPAPVVQPGGGVVAIVRKPFRGVTFEKGQEVCLFLQPHADASFQVAPMYFDVIRKANNPNFTKELAEVKRCLKLLDDPQAGLKAADARDRFTAAAMLLARYRLSRPGMVVGKKTEPLSGEESQQILTALAGADWAQQPGRFDQMAPQTVFFWLGLTPKDGWTQPKDYRQVPEAARKWLAEHKDNFRVQKLVLEKAPQR
jgi:hypothetical protein